MDIKASAFPAPIATPDFADVIRGNASAGLPGSLAPLPCGPATIGATAPLNMVVLLAPSALLALLALLPLLALLAPLAFFGLLAVLMLLIPAGLCALLAPRISRRVMVMLKGLALGALCQVWAAPRGDRAFPHPGYSFS